MASSDKVAFMNASSMLLAAIPRLFFLLGQQETEQLFGLRRNREHLVHVLFNLLSGSVGYFKLYFLGLSDKLRVIQSIGKGFAQKLNAFFGRSRRDTVGPAEIRRLRPRFYRPRAYPDLFLRHPV